MTSRTGSKLLLSLCLPGLAVKFDYFVAGTSCICPGASQVKSIVCCFYRQVAPACICVYVCIYVYVYALRFCIQQGCCQCKQSEPLADMYKLHLNVLFQYLTKAYSISSLESYWRNMKSSSQLDLIKYLQHLFFCEPQFGFLYTCTNISLIKYTHRGLCAGQFGQFV